jgi:hypothetical protein
MDLRLNESLLPAIWKVAAEDLNLEIVTPFEMHLQSGVRIQVPVLVRKFGAREGMLVISDYSVVSAYIEELELVGYGFSTLSEPSPKDIYKREEYIAVLMEWGWTGAEDEKPQWLNHPDLEGT